MQSLVHVLYVDDNPLDRELVQDALEKEDEGFRLTGAPSRQEFEARLAEGGFDLVLSDFNILGFEGLQVIEAVKARDPSLPVVIVTGTGSEAIAVEAMRAGAADYVIKTPRHIQRLPVTIRAVLDKRSLQKEKAKAEAALRQSEANYRELVENANSIILRLDPEGRIIFVNVFGRDFFGYAPEEILGRNAVGTIVPDTGAGQDLRTMIQTLCRDPERYPSCDNEYIRRNGERVWVSWANKAIRDDSGNIKEILCVGNDITRLRQAEDAFKNLVKNAPIGIFIVQHGRFQMVNPAFPKLTHCSEAELLGQDSLCLVAPEFKQLVRDQTRKMLHKESLSPFEFQIITPDGQRHWIMETIAPTHYAGERAILGYCLDTTDQKEMTHQFLQAQKIEAIGRLAGGVAHDFNNMLMAIMGYCEVMRMELRPDDPLYCYVAEISKAGERAASLTMQLLAFSRKQVLEPRVINLNAVVIDLERMLERLIGEDVELKMVLNPELAAVRADPGQIEQMIMNLAVNARDALPQGGKLTIESGNVFLDETYAHRHMEVTPGPYVMLRVSDDGMGIPPDIMAHIFEPFYTTKEAGKGTGLGLSTVYGIVKQSGGHIEVDSNPGGGTSFTIYFPQVAEAAQPIKFAPPTTLPRGSETVLVVEDEDMVRGLIVQTLRLYGYKVLEARNGGEALLTCEQHQSHIHLLLTDVVMPQMSGRELAERLHPLHPEMKVLFMSGYTADVVVQRGVLEEKTQFIQKPFNHTSLISKVREVLDSPKSQ